ncbi:MAG: helix-turn-helix transcriptional regulator [Clostridia bacterium]|nr:helix-turn-helix transcriptional regulator [Clostridia bacterium]
MDLRSVLNYVEENFRRDIGVKDVASVVGYSPRHCNHLFKKYFGETIGEYLRYLRMNVAREEFDRGELVKTVMRNLSYKSESAFTSAFRSQFGVTPSEYIKTRNAATRYVKCYEWRDRPENWGSGANPTSDGLWEFAYFVPAEGKYDLMLWRSENFIAPFTDPIPEDPRWYCLHRYYGYGFHSAATQHAVKSFICPHSGTVELFFSVGRQIKVMRKSSPCKVTLLHNGAPLDDLKSAALLDTVEPVYLTATLNVRAGDRISILQDSLGNNYWDGVMLYRQRIGYLTVEPGKEN